MGVPPPIQFASLGMADSLILMVLALVVFGPRRLPQIGRQIGKLMYEFRKASNDFKFQMEEELRISEEAERRKKEDEERARALALNPPAANNDQASVSAPAPATTQTSPDSGSGTQPEQYPQQTPAAESMQQAVLPRIAPPSTGEQVATDRPGAPTQAEDAKPLDGAVELHAGTESVDHTEAQSEPT